MDEDERMEWLLRGGILLPGDERRQPDHRNSGRGDRGGGLHQHDLHSFSQRPWLKLGAEWDRDVLTMWLQPKWAAARNVKAVVRRIPLEAIEGPIMRAIHDSKVEEEAFEVVAPNMRATLPVKGLHVDDYPALLHFEVSCDTKFKGGYFAVDGVGRVRRLSKRGARRFRRNPG